MTEKGWQRTFVWGSAFFMVLLAVATADSLEKVKAERTPPVTDQVARGKQVFQTKNCNDCHTVLGIGAYYAPDLTKEADARDAAWLTAYLLHPATAKPGTTMPDQQLTQAQVADLVAFLDWVRHIDTNGWPPQPITRIGAASVGVRPAPLHLFETKGCSGCHMIDGQGASGPGPDLSHIGRVPYGGLSNSAQSLARFLANPSAVKPGTVMPQPPLSAAERDTLAQYLAALK